MNTGDIIVTVATLILAGVVGGGLMVLKKKGDLESQSLNRISSQNSNLHEDLDGWKPPAAGVSSGAPQE